MQIKPTDATAQTPCIYHTQIQICMTEGVLIKGFKQSLALSLSLSDAWV